MCVAPSLPIDVASTVSSMVAPALSAMYPHCVRKSQKSRLGSGGWRHMTDAAWWIVLRWKCRSASGG